MINEIKLCVELAERSTHQRIANLLIGVSHKSNLPENQASEPSEKAYASQRLANRKCVECYANSTHNVIY